nr:ATP-dependent DNA helicase [Candidatus Pandoraea novymonadis]
MDEVLPNDVSTDTFHGLSPLTLKRQCELDHIFEEHGMLSRVIDGYRWRETQCEMARAVASAIDTNDTLIAEAGTGTGKTYAYLVPAMLWGGKTIISTGTKHLQDQLFERDIPIVRAALAVPAVTVAILKGRANYLCHYYLERTLQDGFLVSLQEIAQLREIAAFIKITNSGDKDELTSVPEDSPIWSHVTSTRDNCLGQDCPRYKVCFVMLARKEAQQADIVVVNHHLFFADVMLRDTGIAELLPNSNTIIFDEAHQLPETATIFFGDVLSTGQMLELARDTLAEGLTHAREAVDWIKLCGDIEHAARDVRLTFGINNVRIAAEKLPHSHEFFDALDVLNISLQSLISILQHQAERAESLGTCLRRAIELHQQLERWITVKTLPESTEILENSRMSHNNHKKKIGKMIHESDESSTEFEAKVLAEPGPGAHVQTFLEMQASSSLKSDYYDVLQESVRWIQVFSQVVQLHQTPLSIAPIFTKQRNSLPRAWIFTSATLSVKGNFAHYAGQLGLDAKKSLTLPSPFKYEKQSLLYVPRGLPKPSAPGFKDAMLDAVLPVIEASGGRAFVLCTTLRAVNQVADQLNYEFERRGWLYPLLVQGTTSRTELIARFRMLGNAVLIGSQSFWEGVDVVGNVLSLVIIDKLPFAPPDDPVLEARLEALIQKGLSPFFAHQLPQAVITLKQGAGRLIRSERDRGVLMICDSRLVEKPYGRHIWQSLPPFKRTRELQMVRDFFDEDATKRFSKQSISE